MMPGAKKTLSDPELDANKLFDPNQIQKDFPILNQKVHGKDLVYLDNAASTHKPRVVIDRMSEFMQKDYSNVHRGLHTLSQRATHAFENARKTVQKFLNAPSEREIVFLRGVTEGMNLLAQTFVRQRVKPESEILISTIEHHSNIVPWQLLCEETGARLRVIPINDQGEIDLKALKKLINKNTIVLSITHVSNSLGTLVPMKTIIEYAHQHDVPVIVDGAQAAPRMPIDVQELDCDFYIFSGHKTYGPTGIGALFGKYQWLEKMPPYHGGGEMINLVTFEKTTFKEPPARFEAGTPDIVGAVGLASALEYLEKLGRAEILSHERNLLAYATEQLKAIPGLKIIGTAKEKLGVISFIIEGIHPHDISEILDHEGIAVRAGHHCAQPAMERFHVPATTRASLGIYNTQNDIDRLVSGLHNVIKVFV